MEAASSTLETQRLRLIVESTDSVLARIDAMSPADRAEVSPEWMARMRASVPSPWTHGFVVVERASGGVVGTCGFKGAPDREGIVEIAYSIEPTQRGRGYAKEAAAALVGFAFSEGARLVRAHSRPENAPSEAVLVACGFEKMGEVVDPEDGLVWRWEKGGAKS